MAAYGGICSNIDRFPYRHGTSDDVWRRMAEFFPTLIAFPTDIGRLTTYGGVWRDFFPTLIVSPTDMERLTTYLTAYGGLSFSAHQIIC